MNEHKCPDCGKTFTTKERLGLHRARVHNVAGGWGAGDEAAEPSHAQPQEIIEEPEQPLAQPPKQVIAVCPSCKLGFDVDSETGDHMKHCPICGKRVYEIERRRLRVGY